MKLLFSLLFALCGTLFSATPPYTRAEATVPILMYHSVCKTNVGEYTISPARLREDFAYLRAQGYETVSVRALIDYCDGAGDLPQKPIVLTFDDGFYNNAYYVLDAAKEFDMCFTVAVVGSYGAREISEKKRSPVYSYLNPDEIARMQASGRVEFANHSYDMHRLFPRKGVGKKAGEDRETYARALTDDSEKCRAFLSKACGKNIDIFVYPFGVFDADTTQVLRGLGYRAMLTCRGGVNRLRRGDTEALYALQRFERPGSESTATFFKRVRL